jgi:hypothetical protein
MAWAMSPRSRECRQWGTRSMRNIVTAMERQDVRRVIFTSAYGVGARASTCRCSRGF